MYITINLTANGSAAVDELLDELFVASSPLPLILSILAFPLNILILVVFAAQIRRPDDGGDKKVQGLRSSSLLGY